MSNVLVTGANGHIGSHVVRAVIERGWRPFAFVRPGSDRRGLDGLDVQIREGDLLDAPSVAKAMADIEIVLHVGAVHRNFSTDPSAISRPAVEGTRHVLDAARSRGVRRLVYTSTGATVGFSADPARPIDESSFLETARSPYISGKIEAERLVRAHAATGAAPEVVILNPSGVFGPGDHRLTPATRGLIGLLQGDPIFFHLCVTDVRDVARAHVIAAEKGRPGERYLITGDNLSPGQIADLFKQITSIRPATFRPPGFLLRFLVGRMERKAARDGSDTPASRDAIADLGRGNLVYDSTRSRRDLGMTYRPAPEVLRDSFAWLVQVGALKPRVAASVKAALARTP